VQVQLVVALVVMRWQTGNDIIAEIATLITGFLNFAHYGAQYVFGETYADHGFAFGVSTLYNLRNVT